MNDAECVACAGGYTTQNNASQCTPHSPACGSAYDETRAPSQTNDRECACQQTCGDGRCIAENACCEAAQNEYKISDRKSDSVTFAFCIDSQRTLSVVGYRRTYDQYPATVQLAAHLSRSDGLGSWGWSDTINAPGGTGTYTLTPGTYTLSLGVSAGHGFGTVTASIN